MESMQATQANKLATNLTNKITVLLKSGNNRNDTGKLNIAMIIYKRKKKENYS